MSERFGTSETVSILTAKLSQHRPHAVSERSGEKGRYSQSEMKDSLPILQASMSDMVSDCETATKAVTEENGFEHDWVLILRQIAQLEDLCRLSVGDHDCEFKFRSKESSHETVRASSPKSWYCTTLLLIPLDAGRDNLARGMHRHCNALRRCAMYFLCLFRRFAF